MTPIISLMLVIMKRTLQHSEFKAKPSPVAVLSWAGVTAFCQLLEMSASRGGARTSTLCILIRENKYLVWAQSFQQSRCTVDDIRLRRFGTL